jgi:phosphoglycerate dehydrogenase-like enzyme
MGSELEGKSLGMVGFGASGRALARLARAARMRLSCIDIVAPSAQDQHEFGLEFAGTSQDIDSLIAGSDYVSLHVPLTNETRRLMDARRLRLMKPGAMLINVARGALVDTDALYDVLLEGRIGGAGLDVVDSEPIDPNHPLLQLPNFIVLPHVAGNTYSTSLRRAAFAAQNINLVAEGQSPRSRIDLPASAEPQVGLAAAEA